MEVLRGIPVSPGVAIGPALVLDTESYRIPQRFIQPGSYPDEINRLHGALHRATRAAIDQGGVHTGAIIGFRRTGAHCPRCGSEMARATIGGRTTWWCPREQR